MAKDVAREREALKALNPKSRVWVQRVKNMPEDQVTAIYLRFKRQDAFKKAA